MSQRNRAAQVEPRSSLLRAQGIRYGGAALVAGVIVLTGAVGAAVGAGVGVLVLAAATLGAAIAALWLSLRSLTGDRPMAPEQAYGLACPLGEEEHKRTVLRALKDLEYERSVGKISARDYDELRAAYRREARELLHLESETDPELLSRVETMIADHLAAEGLGSPTAENEALEAHDGEERPTGNACPECQTDNDEDARFCKHCGKALSALSAGVLLVALLGLPADSAAQPLPPSVASASPRAETPPAGPPSAAAPSLPADHPPASAPGSSATTSVPMLPPGHPDISGGMPRPAAGGQPFRPPADSIAIDADLPPDTVEAQIVDASSRPRPDVVVTLDILRRSIAKGDASDHRRSRTDEEGKVRFDGLATGSAVSYRLITKRGPAVFSTEPFTLTAQHGVRIQLHAFEWTARLEEARVDVAAFVVLDLANDALSVDQMLRVLTVGPKAWVPDDLSFALPPEHRAFRAAESMADQVVSQADDRVRVTGTFSPGQTELRWGYQVPLAGDTAESLEIPLPPGVSRARVIATMGPEIRLSVDGFPQARAANSPDGKQVQVTERQLPLGGSGLAALRIQLTGLPGRGTAQWYALLAALVVVAAGLSTAWSARRRGADAPEARDDLMEAREVLLGELGALERMHRRRGLAEPTYASFRAALVESLARLERRLDAAERPMRRER